MIWKLAVCWLISRLLFGPLSGKSCRPLHVLTLAVIAFTMYNYSTLQPYFVHFIHSNGSCKQARRYGLIIDAGSTGTRIHLYCWDSEERLLDDDFHYTQPGLAHFIRMDELESVQTQLQKLIGRVHYRIPAAHLSSTQLAIKATAGLRLLPEEQIRIALETIHEFITVEYPLITFAGVEVLDGHREAFYAWLTVQQLIHRENNTDTKSIDTAGHHFAIIDLGGASMQLALPQSACETQQSAKCIKHTQQQILYTDSKLGHGLVEMQKSLLASPEGKECWGSEKLQSSKQFHECLQLAATEAFPENSVIMESAVDENTTIIAFSFVFDRTRDLLGLHWDNNTANEESNNNSSSHSWTVADIKQLAYAACTEQMPELNEDDSLIMKRLMSTQQGFNEMLSRLRTAKAKHPLLCLDLTYIYTIFHKGMQLPDNRRLTIRKRISGIELGWSLGAMLDLIQKHETS